MLGKLALKAIPPQVKIGIVIGAFVTVFFAGWRVNGWRLSLDIEQMKVKAAEAAIAAYIEAQEASEASIESSNAVGVDFANATGEIQVEERIIIKEVIKHVESNSSNSCELDPDWVRLDTLSATGLPDDGSTASGIDGRASRVTTIDLLPVTVERNTLYRECVQQVKSLQRYIREQREILNKE